MPKQYTKNTWQNEILAGAERYDIKEDGGAAFKSDMQILLSTSVSQAASSFDAERMNNIENGIDLLDTSLSSGWIPVTQTWTAASSDDPVYVVYVSGNVTSNPDYAIGNKIAVTISGSDRFGVIVKRDAYDSGNNRTPVHINGGSDYDITGAMSNPRTSKIYRPDGFSSDRSKWDREVVDTTLRSKASPVQNTWYGLPVGSELSIVLPIGLWEVTSQVAVGQDFAATGYCSTYFCLSTSPTSKANAICECYFYVGQVGIAAGQVSKTELINVTAKTTYYPVILTDIPSANALYFYNSRAKMILRARNAYV